MLLLDWIEILLAAFLGTSIALALAAVLAERFLSHAVRNSFAGAIPRFRPKQPEP